MRKAIRSPRQAFDKAFYEPFYRIPVTYLNTNHTIGTNIYEREWDLLIVLDTCRVDALREVADEYEFIQGVQKITSVGGRSPEWIAKTFVDDYESEIRDTAYLSANVFSEAVLEDRKQEKASVREIQVSYKLLGRIPTVDVDTLGKCEHLFNFEPVGEDGSLGHEEGGTPPRYVTDRGIAVGRTFDFDRIILHYLPPHPPYTANAIAENRPLKEWESDWWGYLSRTGDRETIWNTYLDELRYVLDDIEVLLENIDAEKVVITADHGEAFGEYLEYGHHNGSLHPKVRTVPWVETSATDERTYTSEFDEPSRGLDTADRDSQLEALGYKA